MLGVVCRRGCVAFRELSLLTSLSLLLLIPSLDTASPPALMLAGK